MLLLRLPSHLPSHLRLHLHLPSRFRVILLYALAFAFALPTRHRCARSGLVRAWWRRCGGRTMRWCGLLSVVQLARHVAFVSRRNKGEKEKVSEDEGKLLAAVVAELCGMRSVRGWSGADGVAADAQT